MRRIVMGVLVVLVASAAPAVGATRGCEVERGAQKGLQALVALDGRQVLTDRGVFLEASHPFVAVSAAVRHLETTLVFNERYLAAERARYAERCQAGHAGGSLCVKLGGAITATQARIAANEKQLARLRTRRAELAAELLPFEQRLDADHAQLASDAARLADAQAAYRACEAAATPPGSSGEVG